MIESLKSKEDYKLCYADMGGVRLWFTTQDLSDQWGDDWNDCPISCNAGAPYGPTRFHYADGTSKKCERDWNEDGTPKWKLFRMFVEDSEVFNDETTVEAVNKGNEPWVLIHGLGYKPETAIYLYPGDTLPQVIERLKNEGVAVYLPLTIPERWEEGY